MRSKLVVTVLALVIVPTAILSLMASRVLTHWEVILDRGLSASAQQTIASLRRLVDARLDEELARTRSAMSGVLARGGQTEDLDRTARDLQRSRDLIAEVYLFMNPWGFLYPSTGRTASRGRREAGAPLSLTPPHAGDGDAGSVGLAILATSVRREIAQATGLAEPLRFTEGGRSFCMAPLEESGVLYAGYAVDEQAFMEMLGAAVGSLAGQGIRLSVGGRGMRIPVTSESEISDVTVKDPFLPETQVMPRAVSPEFGERPMATDRLSPPFEDVTVSAFVSDPGGVRRAGRIKGRLYGWGILLMAAGVVAGAWAVLREAAAEIRQARARSDFVVGVSHDLRTPVSSLKMLAESLYLGHVQSPERQKKFLATIMGECERLHQLVERVLFFVRFGQDALAYSMRAVEPAPLVLAALEAFCARFNVSLRTEQAMPGEETPDSGRTQPADAGTVSAEGMTLSWNVAADVPKVKADQAAVGQVLLNLLDNAVKYSERGKAEIEVRVAAAHRQRHRLGKQRCWVTLAVQDRGIGISPAERKRIFRKYYRGRTARREHAAGVGLGLAMCRHVAWAHGGWIEVRSRPGKGSTFTVFLPASGDA